MLHYWSVILLPVVLANVARVTPLEKVITLLEDLHAKLLEEGDREAATYAKFETFCTDTKADKTSAITDAETKKTDLQARANDAASQLETEEGAIEDEEKTIDETEEEIAKMKAERKEEELEYGKAEMDLSRALQGLDAAIQMLKAAETATAFMEVRPTLTKTLQDVSAAALSVASVAGGSAAAEVSTHKKHPSLAALTQLLRDIPDSTYTFQSGDIITTLEGLKTQFFDQKVSLNDDETKARQDYETLLQTKESALRDAKEALETHRENKRTQTQTITETNEDLKVTTAALASDEQYLEALNKKCDEKAEAWDKRKDVREKEVEALSRALAILEAMGGEEGGGESFFQVARSAQRKRKAQLLKKRRRSPPVPASITPAKENWRAPLAALLRTKAVGTHSAVLLRAASELAGDDPFAKVKELIQALVERLLEEANKEANHKGWCDSQVTLASEARDKSAKAIKDMNTRLEASEARRARLATQLQELKEEMNATDNTLANATETREQEKKDSETAIEEAEQGRDAVKEAIKVLEDFYKKAAAEAKESLVQVARREYHLRKENPEMPDAGFGNEAYGGEQGAKTGILGLLDVIKSDFERTITETEKAEAQAKKIFNDLETSSGIALAEGEEEKASLIRLSTEAETEDSEERSNLGSTQATLDEALAQLEALQGSCMGSGVSAEERKIQREEEMETLQKALCILDNHEGSIASC